MTAPAFNLATVQQLVAGYATLQGLTTGEDPWMVSVDGIVPDLMHNGEPAWAVVVSDPEARTARVTVRDIVQTPIPCDDPWFELRVTLSHEMWHPWITWLLANPTEEREEALVEAAAQAVVRSAGAEARVMARSIKAIPAAVRARVAKVSARATTRARGGQMDETQVQAALDALIEEGQGDSKCAGILKDILAALAVKGAGGVPGAAPVEPDGDEDLNAPPEARGEGGEMNDPKNKPGAMPPAGPPAPRAMPRAADQYEARARAATREIEAIAKDQRAAAKDSLIQNVRARLGMDHKGLGKIEARINAAPDYSTAKLVADTALDGASDGGDASTRARGENPSAPLGAPPPAGGPPVDEKLLEGLNPRLAEDIRSMSKSPDPVHREAAKKTLEAARARVAQTNTSPWGKGGN